MAEESMSSQQVSELLLSRLTGLKTGDLSSLSIVELQIYERSLTHMCELVQEIETDVIKRIKEVAPEHYREIHDARRRVRGEIARRGGC